MVSSRLTKSSCTALSGYPVERDAERSPRHVSRQSSLASGGKAASRFAIPCTAALRGRPRRWPAGGRGWQTSPSALPFHSLSSGEAADLPTSEKPMVHALIHSSPDELPGFRQVTHSLAREDDGELCATLV